MKRLFLLSLFCGVFGMQAGHQQLINKMIKPGVAKNLFFGSYVVQKKQQKNVFFKSSMEKRNFSVTNKLLKSDEKLKSIPSYPGGISWSTLSESSQAKVLKGTAGLIVAGSGIFGFGSDFEPVVMIAGGLLGALCGVRYCNDIDEGKMIGYYSEYQGLKQQKENILLDQYVKIALDNFDNRTELLKKIEAVGYRELSPRYTAFRKLRLQANKLESIINGMKKIENAKRGLMPKVNSEYSFSIPRDELSQNDRDLRKLIVAMQKVKVWFEFDDIKAKVGFKFDDICELVKDNFGYISQPVIMHEKDNKENTDNCSTSSKKKSSKAK